MAEYMAEYIDRKQIHYVWVVDADGEEHDGVTLQSIIKKMPTVDAVEVVRCKNCKHYHHSTCTNDFALNLVRENDYCSYGERRSD